MVSFTRHLSAPPALALEDLEAGPPAGTLLFHIADLPDHGGKELIFTKGQFRNSIFIQKTAAGVGVFLNHCPHAGTPLNLFGERFLDLAGKQLLCRSHGALFDGESGLCVRGPCKGQFLRKIDVEIQDGAIYSR